MAKTWIPPYTKSDGTKVKGYWRHAAGDKSYKSPMVDLGSGVSVPLRRKFKDGVYTQVGPVMDLEAAKKALSFWKGKRAGARLSKPKKGAYAVYYKS